MVVPGLRKEMPALPVPNLRSNPAHNIDGATVLHYQHTKFLVEPVASWGPPDPSWPLNSLKVDSSENITLVGLHL